VTPAPVTPAPATSQPATPEPTTPEPVALAPEPVTGVAFSPLSPFAALPPAPVPSAPAASVATAVLDPVASPTWPCTSCDAHVALDEMTCPSCGTPFMGGVNPNVSLKVPGVGDLATMTSGMKFTVIAGGAVLFSLLLVLVFLVLGHIF
jgi:hypothetical protein